MKARLFENDTNSVIIRNSKGEIHCEDGPAIEWASENKEWYQNGKLHREDGPAIERIKGHTEHWVDGIRIK